MEKDAEGYRMRIRSAIREEMIHSIQVITAKGKTWDQKRLFDTAKFGTTENLLRFMAGTLRQGVSKLISLSPTLTEALIEIEGTIQKIRQIRD